MQLWKVLFLYLFREKSQKTGSSYHSSKSTTQAAIQTIETDEVNESAEVIGGEKTPSTSVREVCYFNIWCLCYNTIHRPLPQNIPTPEIFFGYVSEHFQQKKKIFFSEKFFWT